LLAQLILQADLPFNIVSNPLFQKFCSSLNPNFKMPCRQTISTTYLQRRYDKIKKEVENFIKNEKEVVLIPDGSTDQCGEPLLNITLVASNVKKPLI